MKKVALAKTNASEDADSIANSVDPDQTACRSSLIWVCTVRPDLSVRKLGNITVYWIHKNVIQNYHETWKIPAPENIAVIIRNLNIVLPYSNVPWMDSEAGQTVYTVIRQEQSDIGLHFCPGLSVWKLRTILVGVNYFLFYRGQPGARQGEVLRHFKDFRETFWSKIIDFPICSIHLNFSLSSK